MRNYRCIVFALLVLLLLNVSAPSVPLAATVKPLEVTERILVLETERLAEEHNLHSALVRRSLERLDRQMNIMSRERTHDSLKLLVDARKTLVDAEKSAGDLSGYVRDMHNQLKAGGHERYLPLERLDGDVEKPYHHALDRFLAMATNFVQYCNDNMEAITSGQATENKRYDEYYSAYLKEMEAFNEQSVRRSQQLADWSADYPSLIEYLPR